MAKYWAYQYDDGHPVKGDIVSHEKRSSNEWRDVSRDDVFYFLHLPDRDIRVVAQVVDVDPDVILRILEEVYVPIEQVRERLSNPSVASPFSDVTITSTLVELDADSVRVLNLLLASSGNPLPNINGIVIPSVPYVDGDQHCLVDSLGVEKRTRVFAKLVLLRDVSLPLSIGIFGHWGSGKTYFMTAMKQQVSSITQMNEDNLYVSRVVQIHFNAWHYSDTNLWASLALANELNDTGPTKPLAEMRRELRRRVASSEYAVSRLVAQQKLNQHARDQIAKELADLKRQHSSVRATLRTRILTFAKASLDETMALQLAKLGKSVDIPEVGSTIESTEKLAETVESCLQDAKWFRVALTSIVKSPLTAFWFVTFIVFVVALPYGLTWLLDSFPVNSLMASGIAFISGSAAYLSAFRKKLGKIDVILSSMRSRYYEIQDGQDESDEARQLRTEIEEIDCEVRDRDLKIKTYDEEILNLSREISRIESGGLVYEFVRTRSEDDNYTSSLGLLTLIRNDFAELKRLLEEWEQEGTNPIERIILYVDDLDRCDPDIVSQVLQGIHLLLAFDLFVVVVGVDPRWLEDSLTTTLHHSSAHGSHLELSQPGFPLTPQNYLEKIFQIPFSIASMGADEFGRLVDDLAGMSSRSQNTSVVGNDNLDQPADLDEQNGQPLPVSDQQGNGRDIDLRSHALVEAERTLIKQLSGFFTTPRLAKRFLNIYRLIKFGLGESNQDYRSFSKYPDGEYQAVLVLLAIVVGFPIVGVELLRKLVEPEDESLEFETFGEYLEWFTGLNEDSFRQSNLQKMRLRLSLVDAIDVAALEIEILSKWAGEVGCYSFRWRL